MLCTLTSDEVLVAETVATLRNATGDARKSRMTQWAKPADADERLRRQIMACKSEIAVSRMFNLCWTGCGPQTIDVGDMIEVRAIDNPSYGLLCVDTDDDEFPFACVHVDGVRCRFVGWEYAKVVKREENAFRGDFLLPQAKLRPYEDLLEIVLAERQSEMVPRCVDCEAAYRDRDHGIYRMYCAGCIARAAAASPAYAASEMQHMLTREYKAMLSCEGHKLEDMHRRARMWRRHLDGGEHVRDTAESEDDRIDPVAGQGTLFSSLDDAPPS